MNVTNTNNDDDEMIDLFSQFSDETNDDTLNDSDEEVNDTSGENPLSDDMGDDNVASADDSHEQEDTSSDDDIADIFSVVPTHDDSLEDNSHEDRGEGPQEDTLVEPHNSGDFADDSHVETDDSDDDIINIFGAPSSTDVTDESPQEDTPADDTIDEGDTISLAPQETHDDSFDSLIFGAPQDTTSSDDSSEDKATGKAHSSAPRSRVRTVWIGLGIVCALATVAGVGAWGVNTYMSSRIHSQDSQATVSVVDGKTTVKAPRVEGSDTTVDKSTSVVFTNPAHGSKKLGDTAQGSVTVAVNGSRVVVSGTTFTLPQSLSGGLNATLTASASNTYVGTANYNSTSISVYALRDSDSNSLLYTSHDVKSVDVANSALAWTTQLSDGDNALYAGVIVMPNHTAIMVTGNNLDSVTKFITSTTIS